MRARVRACDCRLRTDLGWLFVNEFSCLDAGSQKERGGDDGDRSGTRGGHTGTAFDCTATQFSDDIFSIGTNTRLHRAKVV